MCLIDLIYLIDLSDRLSIYVKFLVQREREREREREAPVTEREPAFIRVTVRFLLNPTMINPSQTL